MQGMPKIAACLIVKDSADIIEQAVDSIRPHVDEINVYDTGSDDETVFLLDALNSRPNPVVCVACGAEECDHDADTREVPLAPIRVERGEWRDDFSWAREQSFAMCSDDATHTLWLDDDDLVVGAEHLRTLAAQMPPDLDGLVMLYDYARDEYGTTVCQLWRERLVRRGIGYRWLNNVHEVHVPPDRPARLMMVPPAQVRYIHNRPVDRYPATRNLELLLKDRDDAVERGEQPSPRTLAYIGTELMAHGNFAEAVEPLEQYIKQVDAGWSDERMQVHHKLAGCLRILGNPMAAIHIESEAWKERDDWAEIYIGLAQSYATVENWARAEREALRAVQLGVPQTPLIVNPLEFTLLPWMVIAEARAKLGRDDEAQQAIGEALKVAPENQAVQAKTREIAALLQENELVGAVLLLRETLVRHDENLKAYNLLENLPYVIAERPEVVKARSDQREMVAHYLRPAEYERWYREEPKESTVDDDLVPEIGEHIPRAKRLLEGLQEQEQRLGRKPRVLDLGSNDMWVACYLWLQGGYKVDGIELNKQSVAKGLKRMRHFKAPGRFYHGSLFDAESILAGGNGHAPLYDAIALFEVIEHVPDVNQVLDLMERLLAPDGVIYVSTPNGAYERGQIGEWHRVERKGHLRAIPAHELTESFQRRGEVTAFELQHGERLTYASYRPARKKGKVVFYAGGGWEPWSPASINTTGLGGSETALCQVAVRLAQQGYESKVYVGAEPGLYGGALFRPNTSWDPTEECDLLVVSRLAHVFDNPIGARKTALWCHDHSYPGQLTEERAAKIDHVVVLSEWQRERFQRLYPWTAERLTLIRNGITLRGVPDGDDRYPDAERTFARRKPRVVYSSSADRGLDVLLDMWPRIRERVPDAELHVFYGWDVFDRVALVNPGLHAYKLKVLSQVADLGMEDGGVHMRGRVGQQQLIEEMSQARVWGYPGAFLETSCIGAMEARASGLPIVTSDLAALHETVGEHGILLPWAADEDEPANTSGEYQDRFVDHVATLLTDREAWKRWHRAARAGVESLDWSLRVAEWEQLLVPKQRPKRKQRAKKGDRHAVLPRH